MTRSLALAIGVANVQGLPELTGVRSGVDQFEAWARTQGFDVERFDDLDQPVELAPITAWVRAAVDASDVERLFVYFAGHGVIRGRGEEYWLLTGAGEGIDTEAVNVAKSVAEAFECGILHVAFFADACRSPASQDLSHVTGGSLFPSKRGVDADVEIDEFYAAQFGDPAYEVIEEAEGIFSRYLLRALRGEEAAALEEVVGGRAPLAVLARGLRPVLRRNVRIAAGKLGRRQSPWCRPGSYWEPNVLAWIHPADPPAAEPPPPPRWDDVRLGGPSEPSAEAADGGGGPPEPIPPPEDLDATDAAAVDELSRLYRQSEGRDHFETGIGLTVVGTVPDTAMLGDRETSLFEEGDAWHLRGHEGEPEGALVRLDVEEWAGAALLPGYVGVLTVTPTGSETTLAAKSVDHLAYVPQPVLGASVPADQVVSLVADVTARLQVGSFDADQLDPAVEEALQGDLNPSLAVLVASEWARDGRRRKVRELLAAFERADRPVPFDLTVLAGRDWDDVEVPVVPAFPLLTAVWALVDALPVGDEVFGEVRRRLTPALWTSFHHLPTELARTLAQPTTAAGKLTVGV